ncbi:hypothetical protein FRB93_011029 [Tulasnella sp. JGI-2019a]|nr:hypothetical protein FRB93_011029 [Tulasnella sp. JGI-2019a]
MADTAKMRQPSTAATTATPEPSTAATTAAPEPLTVTTAVMSAPPDNELTYVLPVILMMAADFQMMKDDPDPSTEKIDWREPIDSLMRKTFRHNPQSSTYR